MNEDRKYERALTFSKFSCRFLNPNYVHIILNLNHNVLTFHCSALFEQLFPAFNIEFQEIVSITRTFFFSQWLRQFCKQNTTVNP